MTKVEKIVGVIMLVMIVLWFFVTRLAVKGTVELFKHAHPVLRVQGTNLQTGIEFRFTNQ